MIYKQVGSRIVRKQHEFEQTDQITNNLSSRSVNTPPGWKRDERMITMFGLIDPEGLETLPGR